MKCCAASAGFPFGKVASVDVGGPRHEASTCAPPRPSVGLQHHERERGDAEPGHDVLALHLQRFTKARATFLRKMSKQLGEAAGNTRWYEMSERIMPIVKEMKEQAEA